MGCEYQEMYLCVCQGMAARSRDGQKLQPLSALAGAQGVWAPAYQADHHSHLNSCQSDWNFVFCNFSIRPQVCHMLNDHLVSFFCKHDSHDFDRVSTFC